MHDVNPLGQIMHLRELDRQAVPKLRPLRLESKDIAMVRVFRATVIAVLRGFHSAYSGEWPDVLDDSGFDRPSQVQREFCSSRML
jgi:hypothetical protein